MARMTSLRIILGLFHLTCVIRTGSSCGGNSALKVVEMCKGGSTTDSHFYLHGAPAGGVQQYRCDCNLTNTGAATSVYFTPVNMTNTAAICGGTLTLPDGSLRDCGWTSRADVFMFPGTSVVSFAYSAPDVRFCVDVRVIAAAANISMECPLSPTTTTTLSSPSTTTTLQTTSVNVISSSISTASPETTSPLHIFTSSSTSAPNSTKPLSTSTYATTTTKSTTVLSSVNRSTSPVTNTQSSTEDGKPEGTTVKHTSFPGTWDNPTGDHMAAVAGGAGAGLLLLLVVVIVVILCYRRGRHVDKQEGDKQQENKGPTEVITVTNSLYESSANINNTQPTMPLTTDQQHVNNPTVEGQLPPGLTSGIAPGIAYQHNEKPSVTHQHGGTAGSTAPQDKTPVEPRDGPSDVYAAVNKPKKSLEATNVIEQSKPDPENVSKETSPPPIEDSAIYAKVNKPSLKTNQ